MFLHKGKEYYPLDLTDIYGKDNKKIYERNERKKAYIYIVTENTESKGAE